MSPPVRSCAALNLRNLGRLIAALLLCGGLLKHSLAAPDTGPTTGSILTSATASLDAQVTVPVTADDTATLLDTMALAVMALQVREGSEHTWCGYHVMLYGHC